MRYISNQTGWLLLKSKKNKRYWSGYREKGTVIHCWWEYNLVQPLWNTVWQFLKDQEIEFPLNPAITLLGIYAKDYELFYYKDTCTRMFVAALFMIAKTWNQPKCPLIID